eukprot:9210443-Pyramimonas_sp.AAC.1
MDSRGLPITLLSVILLLAVLACSFFSLSFTSSPKTTSRYCLVPTSPLTSTTDPLQKMRELGRRARSKSAAASRVGTPGSTCQRASFL